MRVGFRDRYFDQQVLKELLSPWEISFTDIEQADVTIAHNCEVDCRKKSIIIPSNTPAFHNWAKKQNLRFTIHHQKPIQIAVSERTCLKIWPQELFDYEPLRTFENQELSPTGFLLNDQLLLLRLDIVKEFVAIISPALFGKPSKIYSLLTGLPVRYDIVPKRVRDFVLESRKERVIDYCEKLPLDALRFVLIKAIEELLGLSLPRKRWKGATNCCLLTHDIDTAQGLSQANSVRKLEESYNLQSAWFIPAKHYPLNRDILAELANHGEVGVHGAKHEGNLNRLPGRDLFSQLWEAKHILEKLTKSTIHGFRSPLLQHSSGLLHKLKEAGYAYDTSIPTWEPRHPQTMNPFGIGTVFPLHLNGLTEIPVSIIQDHQLLYVSGLGPKETLAQWLSFMDIVREIGGCSVLLSHPEYKLLDAKNLFLYEEFLNTIITDKESWFTTPHNILQKSDSTESQLVDKCNN